MQASEYAAPGTRGRVENWRNFIESTEGRHKTVAALERGIDDPTIGVEC